MYICKFARQCQITLHRRLVKPLCSAVWHYIAKLIFASLLSEKWYFGIDLICISLILSEFEHIWMLFVFPFLWMFPYPFSVGSLIFSVSLCTNFGRNWPLYCDVSWIFKKILSTFLQESRKIENFESLSQNILHHVVKTAFIWSLTLY